MSATLREAITEAAESATIVPITRSIGPNIAVQRDTAVLIPIEKWHAVVEAAFAPESRSSAHTSKENPRA
jgi:hypothetical protein